MKGATHLRTPRQARSRRTLDRLAAAAERLLAERRFEAASVADIVRLGRSSVGAFYGRFADKQALLAYLDEAALAEAAASWRAFLAEQRRTGAPLAGLIAALVGRLALALRAKPGVSRALFLYARTEPDAAFRARARAYNREVERGIVRLLARHPEVGHPRPAHAVRLALTATLTLLREQILFEDAALHDVGLGDDALVAELTTMWLAYLSAPVARRPRRTHKESVR